MRNRIIQVLKPLMPLTFVYSSLAQAEEGVKSLPLGYLMLTHYLLKDVKEMSYAAAQIKSGDRVLELGCGFGMDALELAKRTPTSVTIMGADIDETKLTYAEAFVRQSRLTDRVQVSKQDGNALTFKADQFDCVRSERVLQHIPDQEQFCREIVRVTKPGGRIVILDTDWNFLSVNSSSALERKLPSLYPQLVSEGSAIRNLPGLFHKLNIEVERIEVIPITIYAYLVFNEFALFEQEASKVLTKEEFALLRADLKKVSAVKSFFATVNMIMVVGRKRVTSLHHPTGHLSRLCPCQHPC